MAVVRDDDQHARVLVQIILQPVDGIEVQVVGRLVEQQRRRIAEQGLREEHADFLAALQLAHLALVQRRFDAEAVEQDRGVRLRGVAAFVADNSFEFAEAHAVLVGQLLVRFGVKHIPFLESLPQRGVAHDDRVDDAKFVEGKLVLPQNAQLLWPRDRTFRRFDISFQNLHQSGLAGAVRAGDGIAAPFEERAGDVLEQDPGGVAHSDVIKRKHISSL